MFGALARGPMSASGIATRARSRLSLSAMTAKMTKRPCPFDTGVLRQFKIHINNMECDRATQEDVQNKTIQKLFSAQKINWMDVSETESQKKINLKQKHVTNFFSKKNKGEIKSQAADSTTVSCGRDKCSYCDSPTDNIYVCSICFDMFCHSCSFANYISNDEERICLTCS